MKIRTRLTFWYAGVLLVSALLIAGGTYYELVVERRLTKQEHRRKEPMEDKVLDIVLLYCIPSLLVAVVGGWWMTRKALGPLDTLANAAERIHARNLREKIPMGEGEDEVTRLTAVINAMTQRLDRSFTQMRDFTLNASHELKTPLAVMHGELELCLMDPATSPAQRETLASLLSEIQRLNKIVGGLAFLAKADGGEVPLVLESVAFHELVRDVAADCQILGTPRGIQVKWFIAEPVVIQGDPHRLRQVLLNLIENALKYNHDNGTIRIQLTQLKGAAQLEISNTGAGIPPEQISRVFERFFRGDVSHSSRVEGCGLGLTIARSIVLAHGGSIQIDSHLGSWTTVLIQLPGSA